MAIKDLTQVKAEKKYTSSMRFPKDRYTSQCISEELMISKSTGNPMVKQTWQILAPNAVQIGNDLVVVAGVKADLYFTMVSKTDGVRDEKKTEAAQARYKDQCDKLGLDIDWSSFDDENPPMKTKGIIADVIWEADKGVQRKEPAPGKTEGEPIKDSAGNDIIRYTPKIAFEGVLGLGRAPANQPY